MKKNIEINENEFKLLKAENGLLVIDFFATWCGPCQLYGPEFEKLANEENQAKLHKIDIDQNLELASSLNINSVPTTLVFKDSVEVNRFSGFKSYNDLKKIIDSFK